MEDLQKMETTVEDAIGREVSSCSIASIGDEPLAALVIDGVRKFREIMPAIIELRKRFLERPRGNAGIAGCSTWTEFCTQKLGRTLRAVQLALAQPKTDEEKADCAARKELKARIDLAATRQLAAREESYRESKTLVTAVNEVTPDPTGVPIPRAVPVVAKDQEWEEYRLIAAKNIQALELADELLPLLFNGSDGSQHSLFAKYMKLRNIPLFSIPTIE
jgi:hypothetical protein